MSLVACCCGCSCLVSLVVARDCFGYWVLFCFGFFYGSSSEENPPRILTNAVCLGLYDIKQRRGGGGPHSHTIHRCLNSLSLSLSLSVRLSETLHLLFLKKISLGNHLTTPHRPRTHFDELSLNDIHACMHAVERTRDSSSSFSCVLWDFWFCELSTLLLLCACCSS